MIQEHYSAFISYKHAKKDNLVAAEIQKQIERFRIPRAVQKKTGKRKLDPVFRDKAELPITADLNEEILYALEHSDYLIVLCSESTKLSAWVPREIETFLRFHPKQNVLTVLVEGEPYDVIPRQLLTDQRMIYNPDGTVQMMEVNVEPLSCDYRMSFRKARKEELPRLISTMIGCSYNELMMREQRYRSRKALAMIGMLLLMAAVGITYLMQTNMKIQKHLQAEQISKSIILAEQSSRLLEQDDRVGAIQKALEALPSESEDRPITSQARLALSQAVGAYQMPDDYQCEPIWTFEATEEISVVCYDDGVLAVHDRANAIAVWDTETHEKLLYQEYAATTIRNLYLQNRNLIIVLQKELIRIDLDTGIQFRLYTTDRNIDNSAVQENLLVLEESDVEEYAFVSLDLQTGEILDQIAVAAPERSALLTMSLLAISADGSMVCTNIKNMVTEREEGETSGPIVQTGSGETIVVYDRLSGTIRQIANAVHYDGIHFLQDGSLVLSETDNTDPYANKSENYSFYEKTHTIRIFDPYSGEEHSWYSFTSSGRRNDLHLQSCHVMDENGQLVECLVVFYQKQLILLDKQNLKIVKETILPSEAVAFLDRKDGVNFNMILEDGYLARGNYSSTDQLEVYSSLRDEIIFAQYDISNEDDINHILLVSREDQKKVLYYRSQVYDETYIALDHEHLLKDSYFDSEISAAGKYFLLHRSETADHGYILYGYEEDTMREFCNIDLGEWDMKGLLSYDPATEKVLLAEYMNSKTSSSSSGIVEVDLRYGTVRRVSEEFNWDSKKMKVIGSKVYGPGESSGMQVYDYTTGKTERWQQEVLKKYNVYSVYRFDIADSENKAVILDVYDIYRQSTGYWLLDVGSGTMRLLDIPSETASSYEIEDIQMRLSSDGESLLIATDDAIYLLDAKGEILATYPLESRQVIGVYPLKDQWAVVYRTGYVERFFMKDGARIDELELPRDYDSISEYDYLTQYVFYNNTFTERTCQFYETDDALMIHIYSYDGTALYTVDLKDWQVVEIVPHAAWYSETTNRYYVRVQNRYSGMGSTGYFPRYTTEELIEKGQKMIRVEAETISK